MLPFSIFHSMHNLNSNRLLLSHQTQTWDIPLLPQLRPRIPRTAEIIIPRSLHLPLILVLIPQTQGSLRAQIQP